MNYLGRPGSAHDIRRASAPGKRSSLSGKSAKEAREIGGVDMSLNTIDQLT
jgi:hypothetical protein